MVKRGAFLLLCTLSVLALCSGRAFSQQKYEGRIIVDVEIRGAERVDQSEILAVIKIRPGQRYSQRAISEDLQKVIRLGYFSDVRVLAEEKPEGLLLIFQVSEKPIIRKLAFEGNRKFDDKKLSEAVGLSEEGYFDSYLFNAGLEKIVELYKEAGFPNCKVTKSAERSDEGYDVLYSIVEGPPLFISSIKFEGNRSFSAGKLKTLIGTKKRQLFLGGGLFDADSVRKDTLRLKKFYIDNGYRDATVEPTYIYNKERTRMTLIFTIDEGQRYTIGEIELRGNKVFTGREVRKVLKVKPGDKLIETKMIREEQRIQDLYGEGGYIEARVKRKMTYREAAPVADITYEISEGRKMRVGRITIKGNYKTKDKVIRRNITLAPGDVFNVKELRLSHSALLNRRYFDEVHFSWAEGELPDTQDITVEVAEGRTGDIIFGFGVTSNSGAFGNIALTQRNFDIADFPRSFKDFFTGNAFVGAGQLLRLQVQPGTEFSRFSLDFREPYLFDKPVSLSLSLFRHERAYSNYDETRTGAIVGLGRRFKRHFYVEAAFRIENIDINDVDMTSPADLLAVEGASTIQSFIFTARWDKRDNYWLPTKGYQITARVEPAGQLLGGDFDFTKYTLSASCHKTLITDDLDRKHILSLSGKVGFAEPVGDTKTVPIFERFFAGGATTIRGFDFRGVGPHVAGDAIGGESLILASLEYNFPIFEESIRGVIFVDSGGVFPGSGDIDFGQLRASAGVGLRIYIPFFGPIPLSFDWGFPIASEPGDEEEIFSFSIGVTR